MRRKWTLILTLLLVVALLLPGCGLSLRKVPSVASIGNSLGASLGLRFVSNGDGTCYVAGMGSCTDTDVIIPAYSPSNEEVVTIDRNAFLNCKDLTSIAIPNTVQSIANGSFAGCSGLTSITIPFVGDRAKVSRLEDGQYPFGYLFGSNKFTGSKQVLQYVTNGLTNHTVVTY